jgi:Transcription factor zinc-finger
MTCPNCGAAMEERTFEETYGRRVTVDICHACQGLWFDGSEMLQLSPGGTLDLFKLIHQAGGSPRPMADRPKCPRCRLTMRRGSDLQQATRFFYVRCPRDHGRFLTFFQFLRARRFVRTLTTAEIAELRTHIHQINCSNCGAAVDIDRGAACGYCRTPVSMIDPGQVTTTVQALRAADERRRTVDPTLPVRLMQERLRAERAFADADPSALLLSLGSDPSVDLVKAGLRLLWKMFRA